MITTILIGSTVFGLLALIYLIYVWWYKRPQWDPTALVHWRDHEGIIREGYVLQESTGGLHFLVQQRNGFKQWISLDMLEAAPMNRGEDGNSQGESKSPES